MFEELEQTQMEQKTGSSVIGSISLDEPENLDVEVASLELTHGGEQHPLNSPIEEKVSQQEELNTSDWLKIIDRLKQEEVNEVILTGGEPTIRGDFRTILQYAINKFEQVTVQTRGTTARNLSDFSCTVSIPIEYYDPMKNNQVRRMTDPSEYLYSNNKVVEVSDEEGNKRRIQGILEMKQPTSCFFCGQDFKSKSGAVQHVRQKHEQSALERFEEMAGQSYESYSKLSDDPRYEPRIMLKRPDPIPIQSKEEALKLAVQKAQQVDNPVVIRSNVYAKNDLKKIFCFCQLIEADLALKPLYPVAQNKDLLEQVPEPKRIIEAMAMARQFNYAFENRVWVRSPLYKAFKYEKDLRQGMPAPYSTGEYEKWWARGRISEIGISKIHVGAEGNIMPSRYIRQQEYRLGNMLSDTWEEIYANMAEFNGEIRDDDDYKPVTSFDLRNRSVASDPNIYLNDPYPNHQSNLKTTQNNKNKEVT